MFGQIGNPEENLARALVGFGLVAMGIILGTLNPEQGVLSVSLILAGGLYGTIQAMTACVNPPQ